MGTCNISTLNGGGLQAQVALDAALNFRRLIMKKVVLIIQCTICIVCGACNMSPKKIYVDLCESYPIDSVNQVLANQHIPMKIIEQEETCALKIDKYIIVMSKEEGPCISSIVETLDYYMIISTEYNVVGYDISLIYDKKQSVLYKTMLYNLNYMPYKVEYETCDFNTGTIDVIYEDNSIEHVNLNKCTADTIRLW